MPELQFIAGYVCEKCGFWSERELADTLGGIQWCSNCHDPKRLADVKHQNVLQPAFLVRVPPDASDDNLKDLIKIRYASWEIYDGIVKERARCAELDARPVKICPNPACAGDLIAGGHSPTCELADEE